MNKRRRKRIVALMAQLEPIQQEIRDLADDESAAYEGLPENMQDSERGQAMADACEALRDAEEFVEDALRQLSEAAGDG